MITTLQPQLLGDPHALNDYNCTTKQLLGDPHVLNDYKFTTEELHTHPTPTRHPSGPDPRDQAPPWAVHAGRYGQRAGGVYPTGMQSCSFYFLCSIPATVCLSSPSPPPVNAPGRRSRRVRLSGAFTMQGASGLNGAKVWVKGAATAILRDILH